jgi:tetratricopeptide (TPR) repeat protein
MRAVVCVCLIVCAAFFCAGADFEKGYESALVLIEGGKGGVAISKLEKLLDDRKLADGERGRAAVLLARAYLAEGQGFSALKCLEKVESGRPPDYFIVLGEAWLATGNYEAATKTSAYYNVSENAVLFHRALWVTARGRLGLRDYLNCISELRRIISELPRVYEYQKEESLKRLVAEASELLKKALELYETERYGLDYVKYRKGREAEEAGDYRAAIKFYEEIGGGTLKDAGRCYTGHCLAKLGEHKEALKTYSSLVEEDFTGFYRGGALYESAVVRYIEGDLEAAFETASRLNEWLCKVKNDKADVAGINNALKDDVIITAPKT